MQHSLKLSRLGASVLLLGIAVFSSQCTKKINVPKDNALAWENPVCPPHNTPKLVSLTPSGLKLLLCGPRKKAPSPLPENHVYLTEYSIHAIGSKAETGLRLGSSAEKEHYGFHTLKKGGLEITRYVTATNKQLLPLYSFTYTCQTKSCERSASKCLFSETAIAKDPTLVKTLKSSKKQDVAVIEKVLLQALVGDKAAQQLFFNGHSESGIQTEGPLGEAFSEGISILIAAQQAGCKTVAD